MQNNQQNYNSWPELPYAEFSETAYLLHRLSQIMGKLKLLTPFEPHWANVALWPTSRGFTTGPIPHQQAAFSISVDLIDHKVICSSSWGDVKQFKLASTSVADLTQTLLAHLTEMGINKKINLMPQEIPNPVALDQDTNKREYNATLANAWLRIMISTNNVLQRYHARFKGISPAVGLMWGTFDLRDARYFNIVVPVTGENAADYIRRNAMDVVQFEAGFWHGNPMYQKPAFFAFAYPKPDNVESAIVKPKTAHWDAKLGEFILDYDDLRLSPQPAEDLLAFFESTYSASAKQAHWDPALVGEGKPV